MNQKLGCVMLVDDDIDDNFFHERAIRENNGEIVVIKKNTAMAALAYLKSMKDNKDILPDLVFLDINMPRMNGWEFLEAYNLLEIELQIRTIIIILTTSGNPDDMARAKTRSSVSDYITKPLTKEVMKDIIDKYFI
ncbi:MAG: response regulator [Ferruginibacter sp.]